ncbi:MAG: hypothetical protein WKF75_13080, partial [Singulisphaera sp.]
MGFSALSLVFLILFGVREFVHIRGQNRMIGQLLGLLLGYVVTIPFCLFLGWVGLGLCRLRQRARVIASLLICIYAIGMAIVGYTSEKMRRGDEPSLFLALVLGAIVFSPVLLLTGRKANIIFSLPYRDIIAATPHIKPRVSK